MSADPAAQSTPRRTWRDYLTALIHCQHNARVIADFEERMSLVIYDATRGQMSKPYYTTDAMLPMISDAFQAEWEEGYTQGKKDAQLAPDLGRVETRGVGVSEGKLA